MLSLGPLRIRPLARGAMWHLPVKGRLAVGGVEPREARSGLPSSCAHMQLTAVTSALCRPGPCPRKLMSRGVDPDASYRMTAGEQLGRGRAGGWGEEGDPVEGAKEPTHAHSPVEGPGPRLPKVDPSPSFLAGWPWASRSTSRGISFLLYETSGGTVVPTSGGCSEGPVRRHTHNSSGSPWAPLASPIQGRRPGQEEDRSFQGRTQAGQVEGLQAELAPQSPGGGVRPRGKPALPSGGRPWAREPGPQMPPGGCPRISLHPAAPCLLWAPMTSTVEPGHLASRDHPGRPGSGPRCPFSP